MRWNFGPLAAAPYTELKSFGNGRKGRKELVELAPDVFRSRDANPAINCCRVSFMAPSIACA